MPFAHDSNPSLTAIFSICLATQCLSLVPILLPRPNLPIIGDRRIATSRLIVIANCHQTSLNG